jgi:hypothetical protein
MVPSAAMDGRNADAKSNMHIDNASGANLDKRLPGISNARAGI